MGDDESKSWISNTVKLITALAALATATTGLLTLLHNRQAASTQVTEPTRQASPPPVASTAPATADTSARSQPTSRSTYDEPVTPSAPSTAERTAVFERDSAHRSPRQVTLAGAWVEPGGNVITITQVGRSITLRMPMVEQASAQMGIAPALTVQTGMIENCDDGFHLACVELASPSGLRSSLRLTKSGDRLDGTSTNGFSTTPVTLVRR